MNDKKRIKCPICGKYSIPTQDHVPPKCCDNKGKRIIHYFYTRKGGEPAKKETQKGVHYDFICSDCNNRLLGSDFDIEFKKFYDAAVSSSNDKVHWIGDINKVSKCILGHILATNKYSSATWDKEIRNYIHNDVIPKSISLNLFYYPYDAIFTIKHAVPIMVFENNGRRNYDCPSNTMLDCLYFFPFAFIVSEKSVFARGIDLLEKVINNDNQIELDKNTWVDSIHNKLLPTCWPCMISNGKEDNTVDAIIGGGDLQSFNISVKK